MCHQATHVAGQLTGRVPVSWIESQVVSQSQAVFGLIMHLVSNNKTPLTATSQT
jgi:hypothetical protein